MTVLWPADHICICGRPAQRQHTSRLSLLAYGKIKHKSEKERERGGSHSASLPWGLFWKTENYDSVSLPPDNNETLAPVAFKVSKEDRKMLLTPGNGLTGRILGVFLGHGLGWCHAGC